MIKLRDIMPVLESNDQKLQAKVKQLEHNLEVEFPQLESLNLYVQSNGTLHLSSIRIKQEFRRQGLGREIISRIKKFADDNKLIITLAPEAEPRYKERLSKFYKDLGFIYNQGRKKDYRISIPFAKSMYRRPGINESSEPTDSDQWDSWYEYIKYFEYEIEKEELVKLINKYKLKGKQFFNNQLIKLWDGKQDVYLEYDKDNGTADWIKDINDWIYNVNDSDLLRLRIDTDNLYNGHVDSSLSDLQTDPGMVYHYTTEEKWEEIQSSGELVGSSGTGINNRYAYGIFTSTNPEEYAAGTYGNVCLQINLTQVKVDNNLPKLNLEFEPEVMDYLVREYIFNKLEIELRDDYPSDMSPYTVIVNHTVPLQYVTIYES